MSLKTTAAPLALLRDNYVLLGLRPGHDNPRGWPHYGEGHDLADERSISMVAMAGTASPTSQLFNPGMGQLAYAGVRHRF